jgi:hypothetical protein
MGGDGLVPDEGPVGLVAEEHLEILVRDQELLPDLVGLQPAVDAVLADAVVNPGMDRRAGNATDAGEIVRCQQGALPSTVVHGYGLQSLLIPSIDPIWQKSKDWLETDVVLSFRLRSDDQRRNGME